jgi:hypothetical protein
LKDKRSLPLVLLSVALVGVLFPPRLGGQAAGPGPVTLTLQVHGAKADSPPLQAEGVAEWFGTGKAEPVRFKLDSALPTQLSLQPGRWVLRAQAPGFWGAPYQLDLAEPGKSHVLEVWPAGQLQGEVTWDTAKPPSELVVFFRSPPAGSESKLPPGRETCLLEGKTWRCTLPALPLDLRFQSPGYIPRYQWGVAVAAGKSLNAGRIELRQGSAVQGWVVTADRTPPTGTRISLRPRIGGALTDAAERKRLESLRFEATVNPQGFFELAGVPPGAYLLEAKNDRFAPAVVSVRVVPGEVTQVANPPLLLDQPKVVEVFVDPPVDPAGKRWRMKLQKMDRDSSVVETFADEPAGEDGSWRKKGVPMGEYFLRVSRSGDEAWWGGPLMVDENPEPLRIQLDVLRVQGTVTLGEEPLAAKVWFGGRHGAVRIEAQSDAKGRFETFLPHAGGWPVSVSAEKPAVQRELAKVKIEPKPGTRVAEIELLLPDTLLRGRVVDERNDPIPGAIVTAESQSESRSAPVQALTDKEGRFEIRGLARGAALIEADAGEDRFADPTTVDVLDSKDDKSWILVAHPRLRLSGLVSSLAGPVPGARIKAAPVGLPYLGVRLTTSDAQGRFEVLLPRATREIHLAVGAPGFAFRMLRVPVPEGGAFGVNLEQNGGTLILEPRAPFDPGDAEAPGVFLVHGGSVEAVQSVLAWAAPMGGGLDTSGRSQLPGLEPGAYQACLIHLSELAVLEAGLIPKERCVSGILGVNGELKLKLPGWEATPGREGR